MKKELTHRIYKEKMSGLISDLFILSRTCQDRHVANMIARHASSIQDLLFDMSIELDDIKEEICDVMQSQCSLNFDHHFRSKDLLEVLEKMKPIYEEILGIKQETAEVDEKSSENKSRRKSCRYRKRKLSGLINIKKEECNLHSSFFVLEKKLFANAVHIV